MLRFANTVTYFHRTRARTCSLSTSSWGNKFVSEFMNRRTKLKSTLTFPRGTWRQLSSTVNWPTISWICADIFASSLAEELTCWAPAFESPAALLTPWMFSDTSFIPLAASAALLETSLAPLATSAMEDAILLAPVLACWTLPDISFAVKGSVEYFLAFFVI